MAKEVTEEQVLEAAGALDGDEFTREQVAEKLGSEISDMRPSWKAAKDSGKLERVRNEDGQNYFKLASG